MDAKLGTIEGGDVLIEGRKIKAVGKNLGRIDAEEVRADGMILIPGMLDAHRHVWQQSCAGQKLKDYFEDVHMRLAVAYQPEDVHFGQYIGGLTAIDAGVTRVVDHCHIAHTPEKGDAAARGIKDSGVAGIFCYQISASPTYGVGATVSRARAYDELFGPYDAWHVRQAENVRDRYFGDKSAPLQFGLAMSPTEMSIHTVESMCDEVRIGRRLGAKVITHHLYGLNCRPSLTGPMYRAVPKLYEAGLIGPDWLVSHGNQFTPEEFEMIARAGGALCGASGDDGVDTRARSYGIRTSLGVDSPIVAATDYLAHVRTSISLGRGPGRRGARETPMPTNRESMLAALHTATLGGMASIGMDDVAGSIVPGKDADLVLFGTDRLGLPQLVDPVTAIVGYGSSADIDSVWVAGVARKRNRKMVGIDMAALKARAMRDGERIGAAAQAISLTGPSVKAYGY